MQNTIVDNVKIQLSIKPTHAEFLLQILEAFKQKKMLDFSMENPVQKKKSSDIPIWMEGPPLAQEELVRIVEEAENAPKLTQEEFWAKLKQ